MHRINSYYDHAKFVSFVSPIGLAAAASISRSRSFKLYAEGDEC